MTADRVLKIRSLLILRRNRLGLAYGIKFIIVLVKILVFQDLQGNMVLLLQLFNHVAVFFFKIFGHRGVDMKRQIPWGVLGIRAVEPPVDARGHRGGRKDPAQAVAHAAYVGVKLLQFRPDALARYFHEPEL